MKRKQKWVRICAVVLVLAVMGTVWWFLPRKVLPDSMEIASVRIFNGNTGKLSDLDTTAPEGVELLQLLHESTLTKRRLPVESWGSDGTGYLMELYNANGRCLRKYELKAQDAFHAGIFSYHLNEPEEGTLEVLLKACG